MTKRSNPWITKETKVVYNNPWIEVKENAVVNPSGGDGIYGVVHFKNLAIGVIPLDENNNTWLVGQHRYSLDEYSWEIPMGGGPMTTDPLLSAQRELKEETGLSANDWKLISKIHTSNSVTDELGLIYTAKDLTHGETEFEDTEVLEIKKLPFDDAVEMVMNGQITDAISMAGILKVNQILSK